jgi:hypothetical protein
LAEADYYLLGGADDAGGYCDLHGEDYSAEFIYTVNRESRAGKLVRCLFYGVVKGVDGFQVD